MKKILITGDNSYIGGKVTNWLEQWPDNYHVDEISLREDSWKEADFSSYDTVFHVAGIAHVSKKSHLKDLYYEVNRDLAVEVAEKAKKDGVPQFIFMSSIIVYGTKNDKIDKNTAPNPDNFYGDSKLQAEKGLLEVEDDHFKVVILRVPMIYGEGSKGNYPKLSQFAKKTPLFPNYENQRSMLYVNHLAEFIRLMIDYEEQGMFFPQNKEYANTTQIVETVAKVSDNKVWMTKLFNPFIRLFSGVNIIKKVFGNLAYDKNLSVYPKGNYQLYDFEETIRMTERGEKD